jgi:cell division protease FtsH
MHKRTHFSIWYVVGAFFLILMLQNLMIGRPEEKVAYSEFKELIRQEKVKEVLIGPELIMGTFRGDEASPGGVRYFRTVRVEDPDLVKDLQTHGVEFSGRYESPWVKGLLGWIFPLLILFVIWGFVFKRLGTGTGVMTFGKSRAKVFAQENLSTTFDDVAGVDEAKEELKEIIDFLKVPERFQALGGKIPKGVLLVGPPGTGKTLLAKAVAGEAEAPFFSLTGSDFVEMFVGVGAARVRDLFSQAQQKAPCIIFIDELDALGKARGVNPVGGHDEREQTLNQLLAEMDGFDPKKGVIIMAATNRPEILDPALLRPGRFDRHVLVDRPDLKGREAILRVHSQTVKLSDEVNLETLAARTPGMVGADLANVVNEAALMGARKDKKAVEMVDFEEAIDRVMAGLEKKNRVMSEREREIVAYHELGHALAAELLPQADPVHKISIVPRGIAALGYTQQLPTEERFLMTKSELLERLAVLLGGRAAEEVVFGEISTGAHNDLEKASDMARRMVTEYGMSERQGPVAFEKSRRPLYLDIGYSPPREYSEETAREIDEEVRGIVLEAYERAKALVKKNREALDRVAAVLLQKEVLEGKEFRELLSEKRPDAAGEKGRLHTSKSRGKAMRNGRRLTEVTAGDVGAT